MGELKCGPFELDLEDKVRLYPSVGSDSQRRELDRVETAPDKEPGDPSSWPGFAWISCNSLWAKIIKHLSFLVCQIKGLYLWMDLSACWRVYQADNCKGNVFSAVVFVQLLCQVWLFVTPWTAACQASLSFTISWSLPKFMFIASVMLSSRLILWHPLLLLPSVFPSIRGLSSELSLKELSTVCHDPCSQRCFSEIPLLSL